jgi:hypothetical protein
MLRSAIPVIKEILSSYPKGGTDIETIARIISAVTHVDTINYVGYDVPNTNPILGSFLRFRKRENVYADEVDVVEVRYALHLDEDMKRFVVYKELCHSLEEPDGKHNTSDQGLDDLVTAFSLFSSESETETEQAFDLHSFGIEMLALITAIEVICPLPRRKRLIEKFGNNLDMATVCGDYGLPRVLSENCFKPRYLLTMERVYRQYGLIA